MKPAVEGVGPGRRHTGRRVLSRATRHIGNYCLQPGDFGLVGAGRGGLHGNLALRSPTDSLAVSGVGVTGPVRGRTSRLLLLLGAVVGVGPRLAQHVGELWLLLKTVKKDHLG